ncbi:flavonol synthase/flavanone 3-hydroxylase-like [Magnolia sinica]|uniref:flavonol synthase/flavanone 3-hydroxylase-like n=1 Tax=Magnolia sinica TaxID=86752 RepID=UPI0026590E51|nr:flavonol synthase/flavanone 3-hydroxylase-like [Magnolia sinica]
MEVERVQSLASVGLNELPSQFVRPAHEQPANTKAVQGVKVPKISLSQPDHVVKDQVASASREWGFFVLTDHGISADLIRCLQDSGKEFFQLPQEEKERYANDPTSGNMEGYGTKMTKNLEQKVEWIDYYFHLMAPLSRVNYKLWPTNPPSYREVTEEYGKEVMRVVDQLLELLSVDLGLERTALKATIGGDRIELEMKINFYPPCPQPELALGVEPHTDMSALTLLVQNDVPGLQLWKDGNWVTVDYSPDALFVHIGDQMEVLSNGKYKSILHRSLVSKDQKRMSWAVFCAPPGDAVIGPLPQLVGDDNPPLFNTKTYKEFQYRKFNKLPQ